MRDRLQCPVGSRAQLDPLDHGRPVAEPVHLRPGENHTHRALQRERRQRGQHHLVLRPEPRAEATAHEGRHDADTVRLDVEHAAEVALDVLHPLGLVEDRELAVAFEYRRRGVQLHRVVVLDRDEVFALVAHFGRGERCLGVAARLRRRERVRAGLRGGCQSGRLVPPAVQVGDVRLLVVVDPHQGGREPGDLRLFGDNQRDRLAVEQDPVVV